MGDAGSSSKHGIIVVGEPKYVADDFQALAAEHEVAFIDPPTRAACIIELEKLASKGTYDAVLLLTFFPKTEGRIDKEMLGVLGGSLKLLAGKGAGFDHIDTSWLDSIGAWYSGTPNAVGHPTATGALLLILQCLRHASQLEATVRRGEWRFGITIPLDERDLVVGIVGMGSIGKMVRDKVQALGMRVIYYNRSRLPPDEERGATFVSFDELLRESQLISLHCPLTPETHHLLSKKEFDKMKKGVIIVNTSRGKVIDEEALVEALKSGQVDRAGLDVFENEPEVHPYLLTSEKCTLSPHFTWSTLRTVRDEEVEVLENAKQWIKTGVPQSPMNHPVPRTTP